MALDTFGERLTSEREDRGLSLESVATSLRVDPELLVALERDDFDSLPGKAAMREYFEGYARCLDVDADLMFADWVQERESFLRGRAEQRARPPVAGVQSRRTSTPWMGFLVVGVVAVAAAWWFFTGDRTPPPPEHPASSARAESPAPHQPAIDTPPVVAAPQETAAATPSEADEPIEDAPAEPSIAAVPAPEPPPTPVAVAVATASTTLRVRDYGVGTGVENRLLVGRGDAFAPGTRVYFWTHVLGGSGDRIDHVWLREGVERSRIPLRIGGPSWRTHSIQTLGPGSAGAWVVEARDATGRVLARSEFDCSPSER